MGLLEAVARFGAMQAEFAPTDTWYSVLQGHSLPIPHLDTGLGPNTYFVIEDMENLE